MSIDDRAIAITTYNECMDLLYREGGVPDITEAITLAAASKYHWSKVGAAQQFAISDWLMSRVFALAKEPVLAINFANASLKHDQTDFPLWLQASLHEGLARALQSGKFYSERDTEIALAIELLDRESNTVDAQYIREQVRDVPRS